ncbi:CHAT domain-containing protein [Carboxylicivirga marina]|uniref:CHAT domain-containing protein n=1 Tax=Carboxylicivirga marina TaxID=2800988 RepID=A0ABS1HL42_9BACT|nr:CHAT domain-containing protein [Carboxylicivirga marina]MBK3518394.1 CHAT domain-containing protein [Carboxylicivirga marina]
MKSTLLIILILCLLSIVKKSYSQEINDNIIYFSKHYSSEDYKKAAEIGSEILNSDKLRPQDNERFRLLYKTIRSYAYSDNMRGAYTFLTNIPQVNEDKLFNEYIKLYIAVTAINNKRMKEAKRIYESFLSENNMEFLTDSVKAKIYHNLSVIVGFEGNEAKRLQYLTQSFELEKQTLLNNSNFENYNLSVEVYTSELYKRYRQYEKAYRVFQEALSLPFNKEVNVYNHAFFQNYIELLLTMGMEEKAQVHIENLSQFYQKKGKVFLVEYCSLLNSIANHYFLQNNYTEAILLSSKILSISSVTPIFKSSRTNANDCLARCYFSLQQYDKMRYYLLKDIEECKQLDKVSLSSAYVVMAHYLSKIYDDNNAYTYIDSALNLRYNELRLPLDRINENITALAYFELGQYSQSLYHLENVNKVMVKNGNYTSYLFWDNQYERALCYNHLKQYREAYQLLKKANSEMLRKYPHLYDKASTIQNSRFGSLYRNINIALAENLYKQYLDGLDLEILKKAMDHVEEAGKSIEILRNKQNYDRDRLVTGEMYYDFTLQSSKVSMALYKATQKEWYLHKTFEYIQKGKSYALTQGINEKNYKLNSGVPLTTINLLNQLKDQYDRYEDRYNEAFFGEQGDSNLITSLNDKMSQNMAKIDSVNRAIEREFPSYQEEKARAPFLSIKEIQNRLSDEQVIVDYYQTEEEIFRFTISKQDTRCDIIPTNTNFKNNLQLVVDEISTPFVGQYSMEHMQRFAHASHSLYLLLLKDIELYISDKELIIVPHSELSYLPFEVLLTEDCADKKPKFSAYPWLIKSQVVSYSYNTALLNQSSNNTIEFNNILAFAPEYYGSSGTQSIDLNNSRYLDSLLAPLTGAQNEISAIDKLFRTSKYKGKEANKDNFIASMQNNDILHLAMHSVNDEALPFNSQLIFASKDSSSGSFKAGEIYNYNIKSPLAVLSSCSTGRGQKQKGEGLLSIARAFTYSGVESQVMTLWPVNDLSGANIVNRFYQHLKEEIPKNIALQQSKLNYLATADGVKSHPYYWANYVLAGNTSPVKQQMPKGIFVYLLAFAILSVILLFIYDKRKVR